MAIVVLEPSNNAQRLDNKKRKPYEAELGFTSHP